MTMFMFATVQRVGNASLLVYDHSGSQEVVVHTPNAHCFSPGEEIFIKYNGIMTLSIPPQISANCISKIQCIY